MFHRIRQWNCAEHGLRLSLETSSWTRQSSHGMRSLRAPAAATTAALLPFAGYTKMSDNLEAQQVLKMLHEYFTKLDQVTFTTLRPCDSYGEVL